ncbi:hypothetical protein JXQ70_16820 [bacterium]|nr:hypothetical protein [bacterium]
MKAEKIYFHNLLTANKGKIGLTAHHSGLNPRTLYEKMKLHKLDKIHYKKKKKHRSTQKAENTYV